MAMGELDPLCTKALRLLHSKSRESCDQLSQLIEDVVAQKHGTNAQAMILTCLKLPPPSDERRKNSEAKRLKELMKKKSSSSSSSSGVSAIAVTGGPSPSKISRPNPGPIQVGTVIKK